MTLSRLARVTSAAVVAGVAAIASYAHMADLARQHGQPPLLATLLPVSVDGMLVVASAVMADDRAAGRPPRLSARVSFVVGVAASIVANVLAAPDDLVARVISAWPALALLLVVEMLAARPASSASPTPAAAQIPNAGSESAAGRDVPPDGADGAAVKTPPGCGGGRPSTAARVLAARAADPDATVAAIARQARVSDRTARRHLNGTPAGQVAGSDI